MSNDTDSIVFETVELLSLYTTMAVKRIVLTNSSVFEKLTSLIEVVESNLTQFKMERKWFLATLRDHSRLHHRDWSQAEGGEEDDPGRMRYNTLLLVLSLKVGLEKLWPPDGCLPLQEELIQDFLLRLSPSLALTELNQTDPMFEFLAKHSPRLRTLYMPLSDNSSFKRILVFRNLRVLELAGGVSDKVLCNGLWNIDKKSEKLLDLVLKDSKENTSWQLSLPHLEVLRNNMLLKGQSAMRIPVGAVALALQPKIETVETLTFWNTFDAVLYLLDMEAKHKNGGNAGRKLNVSVLSVNCQDINFDQVKRATKACPNLSYLRLMNTENIRPSIPLLCSIVPMKQLTKLDLEAMSLTDLELTVLLAEMANLENLTLHVMPQDIVRFNLPVNYFEGDIPEEDAKKMSMFPSIKTLTLEFLPNDVREKEYSTDKIVNFLSAFPWVKELYLSNTLLAPPAFLVYGCIGGSLAVLKKLTHLSVISCHEDVPRELPAPTNALLMDNDIDYKQLIRHCTDVPVMLMDLQDEVTFKYLRGLKSLVIDEFYLHRYMDYMIESLRLCGVHVSVLYRSGVKKGPNRGAYEKIKMMNLAELEDNEVQVVKKYVHVKKYKKVMH
ncbi:uncharacterized protein LOC122243056 [Penaeus japonicus]|uniref:uncharacterized protein LOC122243056 n=1 Tax=Penaeus japonicus TaxID=27405 RepID=UPI001C710AF6|nr:uncharacterized protein LOC122243056 [Penaeus japonicus]